MRKKLPGPLISNTPWHPGCRIFFLSGPLLCALFWCVPTFAQQPANRPPAREQATIYPEDYSEPPKDLLLGEKGARRSETLALYYRAAWLRDHGHFEKALSAFEKLLDVDPVNVRLAAETATMCASLQKFDRAVKILEDNLSKNPDDLQAYLNLSRHCGIFHNDKEEIKAKSIDYGRQAMEKFPTEPEVYRHMIGVYLAASDKPGAEEVVGRAIAQDVDDPNYWLGIAVMAEQAWPLKGDAIEANAKKLDPIYEKALAAADGDERVEEKVVDFYAKAQRWDQAIAGYQKIIDERPDYLTAREKLARIYRIAGREDDAVEALEGLLEVNPKDASAHHFLADIYEKREDKKGAIKHRSEALELGEGEAEQYESLARMMLGEKMNQEALKLLKRARFLYPERINIAFLLAATHAELDEHKEALEVMADVARPIEESQPDALTDQFYFQWGAMAEQAKEYEKAEELFRKAIDRVAEDAPEEAAKSYNYLGYMWLEIGKNRDEAGELIKQALQLKPDTGAYQDSLGWFHYLKGEYKEALELFLKAEQNLEEKDPVVFDHIAQTYAKLGKQEDAIRYAEMAVGAEGSTDEMKSRLARYQSGDLEEPKPKE